MRIERGKKRTSSHDLPSPLGPGGRENWSYNLELKLSFLCDAGAKHPPEGDRLGGGGDPVH